jgi:hypothetical protein
MGREIYKDGCRMVVRALVVVNFTLTLLSAIVECLSDKSFLQA